MLHVLIFIAIVSGITGIIRWFVASRWLAFLISVAPLVIWMIYSLVFPSSFGGEGGAMAVWVFVGVLLVIALPVSAITVFIIPTRHDKPSA
jgi:hypothetical protein